MSTRPIPSNGDRSRQQARLDERSQARTSARAFLRATAVLLAPVFPASLGAQGVEEICSGRLEEFDQPPFDPSTRMATTISRRPRVKAAARYMGFSKSST